MRRRALSGALCRESVPVMQKRAFLWWKTGILYKKFL